MLAEIHIFGSPIESEAKGSEVENAGTNRINCLYHR